MTTPSNHVDVPLRHAEIHGGGSPQSEPAPVDLGEGEVTCTDCLATDQDTSADRVARARELRDKADHERAKMNRPNVGGLSKYRMIEIGMAYRYRQRPTWMTR